MLDKTKQIKRKEKNDEKNKEKYSKKNNSKSQHNLQTKRLFDDEHFYSRKLTKKIFSKFSFFSVFLCKTFQLASICIQWVSYTMQQQPLTVMNYNKIDKMKNKKYITFSMFIKKRSCCQIMAIFIEF